VNRVVVVVITGLLTYFFAPRNDWLLWFIIATLFATMFVVTSVTVRLFAPPAKQIPPDYRTVLWGQDSDEPSRKK
jgi:VIT1/CCC1 family predicted Fe2+/Mn2+ transporter